MLGIDLQEVIVLVPLVAIYLLASVALVPFVAPSKGRSGLAWMLMALLMTAAPMSAVVVSARSRGRALRHHQEELLREGDAGGR